MSGLRVDGDYLLMEHSEKPQKWSPAEFLAGLRWAAGGNSKIVKLEQRFRDLDLLMDYLGLEIQDLPAARKVVKKEK